MTGWPGRPPPPAAVAQHLLLGELLAGPGPRWLGRPGFGGEAEPPEGGHGANHLQEVAPADPDGLEALGEEIQLGVRNSQWRHGVSSCWGYFSLGSRASRTPSPKKVNESMVTAMAIDGNTHRCQWERRDCWFSPSIWPHEGVGGLMPTPMNESAASVKMAVGIPKVIETTIGVRALGRTWRDITRQKPAPRARAPSTNSFSLMERTWARVCRAVPHHPGTPTAREMWIR